MFMEPFLNHILKVLVLMLPAMAAVCVSDLLAHSAAALHSTRLRTKQPLSQTAACPMNGTGNAFLHLFQRNQESFISQLYDENHTLTYVYVSHLQ